MYFLHLTLRVFWPLQSAEVCSVQVGHDWGGAVAWALAEDYPSKLTKIVVVNSAHLSVLGQLMWTNFQQLWRTWYICEFPHPLCVYCTCKFIPWHRGHPSLPFHQKMLPHFRVGTLSRVWGWETRCNRSGPDRQRMRWRGIINWFCGCLVYFKTRKWRCYLLYD
jgi:pimeloyl-ACP methyl ester carboxylesterase